MYVYAVLDRSTFHLLVERIKVTPTLNLFTILVTIHLSIKKSPLCQSSLHNFWHVHYRKFAKRWYIRVSNPLNAFLQGVGIACYAEP